MILRFLKWALIKTAEQRAYPDAVEICRIRSPQRTSSMVVQSAVYCCKNGTPYHDGQEEWRVTEVMPTYDGAVVYGVPWNGGAS